MLEVILCSLLTILPDYLFRRFVQGKRFGHEITLFSVWYELRWGITLCLILTTLLITVIFYFHPATTSATSLFRGVPILPETNGRVSEIYVGISGDVKKGQPIFKLDSTEQEATAEVARRRITEIEAEVVMAEADTAAAEGQVQQAQNSLKQYEDELRTKLELVARNSGTVSAREIERLQTAVAGAKGQVAAAEAAELAASTRATTLLPAQRSSAEAQLNQAQVELDKMVVYAGVDGRIEQFILRVGDIVNPFMRPAGLLIPKRLRTPCATGRFRADRGPGDESRHGSGGDLRFETAGDHSVGRHQCAGLYRIRSDPGRRTVDRRAAGCKARHYTGDVRAAVRGGTRWPATRQQLYRQRLHQQS